MNLNGKDILENDFIFFRDLGIVNGDLIYVLFNNDEEEIILDNFSVFGFLRFIVYSIFIFFFYFIELVVGLF